MTFSPFCIYVLSLGHLVLFLFQYTFFKLHSTSLSLHYPRIQSHQRTCVVTNLNTSRGFVCSCICTSSELWIKASVVVSVSNRMTDVAEKLQRRDRKLIDLFLSMISRIYNSRKMLLRAVRIFLDRWQQIIYAKHFDFANTAVTFEAPQSFINKFMLLFVLRLQKKYVLDWLVHHFVVSSSTSNIQVHNLDVIANYEPVSS